MVLRRVRIDCGGGYPWETRIDTEKSDPDAETLNRPDSGRDVSISLSAYAFCQGELGATDLSRIHLARFGA